MDSDSSPDYHERRTPKRQCHTDVSPRAPHYAQAPRYCTTGSNRVCINLSQNGESVDNHREETPPKNGVGTGAQPAVADDVERFDSNELREMPQDSEPRVQDKQNGGAGNFPVGRQNMFSAPINRLPETDQMMDPHDSYHYEISGDEAEFRLKMFRQIRSYLTRYSANHKQYLLSVYQSVPRGNKIKHETRHFVITFKHGDRKIYQITKYREFGSLEELLGTYERENVDHSLPNIGRMFSMNDYLRLMKQHPEPQEITLEDHIEQQLAQQQHPRGEPAEPERNAEDQIDPEHHVAPGQNHADVEDAVVDVEAADGERPNRGRRCLIL